MCDCFLFEQQVLLDSWHKQESVTQPAMCKSFFILIHLERHRLRGEKKSYNLLWLELNWQLHQCTQELIDSISSSLNLYYYYSNRAVGCSQNMDLKNVEVKEKLCRSAALSPGFASQWWCLPLSCSHC